MCKLGGKFCKVIVDSGSIDNLVFKDMVENLGLRRWKQPSPFKVSLLQREHKLIVNGQCLVSFQIGSYKVEVLCDVMTMNSCHVLLVTPWQFDRESIYDGKINWYTIMKDGQKYVLSSLKEKENQVT